MDISRQNHTKKGNKENAEPAHGSKPFNTRKGSKTLSSAPPHVKLAPGLYKGKVVQSKIGSIWKSSVVDAKDAAQKPTSKPSSAIVQRQRVNKVMKRRSLSVADLPGQADQKPKPARSNSVSNEPLPVPKQPVTGRPQTGLRSAATRPHTTRPGAPSSTRMGAVAKITETKVVGDKVNKPPVSSSLSRYRVHMESAEERRAKLADWLASKGKALKRPLPAKTTKVPLKPQVEPKSTIQCDPEPEPSQDPAASTAVVPVLSANLPRETVGLEDSASDTSSPLNMSTTQDLLDYSDTDLPVESQPRGNDIVINLCEALSALATTEDVVECIEDVKTESDSEEEEDETRQTEMMPRAEHASSMKYNVKTTPYLQSVKKGLQDEVHSSRKKLGIRDLKFVTPVRRSSRIHRNSSRLPPMVLDHDPCVSSLAELAQLDGDDYVNLYIHRKNPAFPEDPKSIF
ncbi:hypothetical protein NHX12_010008 [Muraenolepis orangiensis]|uniref:Cytoskeleton-associated protein 2 C-terminal domain-containing protein n=1 Tax=Muraenolepis orangiensis TaxID=630683 RepID=A0A9Q0DLE4_9TELE|nr:hypothetical protein NHX12_010008 [Muraenolepis orangiensis]